MSKRGASEYITKENGSIPSATGSEVKPQMASAAQMSGRKMATPRGRLNRSGTPQRRFPPAANSSTGANPFSSIPQQTFGAVGNGLVFGAQDNNASPQNTGFTFSAGSTSGSNPFAASTNPFANMNGAPMFGGQNTQSNNSLHQDESMDTGSPDKKRSRPSDGGIFGASQTASQSQNNNPFGGINFGASPATSQSQTAASTSNMFASQSQSQTSAPTFSFGGAQSQAQTPAAPSNIFGQSQTKPQPPSTNPFGGAFALSSTTAPSQSAAPTFSFGATSQSQKETSNPPSFNFGAPQKQTESASPAPSLFGASQSQSHATPAASNPFAGLSATSTTTPASQAATPASSAPTPVFGSLFGASTPTSLSQTSAPASTNIFAKSQSETPSSSAANPFSGFGVSAPTPQPQFKFGQSTGQATPEKPLSPSPNLFGAKPASTEPDTGDKPSAGQGLFGVKPNNTEPASEKQPPPFSGLFGLKPTDSDATPAMQPASSFSFGQPPKPAAQASPEKQSTTPASLFGQPPNPATQTSPEKGFTTPAGLFGQTPKPAAQTSPEKQSITPASLFGQAPKPVTQTSPVKQATAPSSLFGQPSNSQPSPEKSSSTTSNIFGQSPKIPAQASPEKQSPPATGPPASLNAAEPPSQLSKAAAQFGASQQTSASSNKFGSLGNTQSAPKPAQPAFSFPSTTQTKHSAAPQDVQTERPVYTKSPSHMPKSLNSEGFFEFDKNYRLRALNKEFQKKIASLDADCFDFDNIVRHYVAARGAIGGDMGLYQRTIAGTKRKTGEVEQESVPPQYKKARMSEGHASQGQNSKRGSAETGFVPTSIPASNPFSSISAAPTPSNNSSQSTNIFGVNNINAGMTPAVKKTTSFGAFQGSTTPVKSPPKKSLFGMPSAEPSIAKKRKSNSDDEADDVEANDAARLKKSKMSTEMHSIESNDASKRKASHEEDDEVSSEDGARKNRSKSSTSTPRNIFGAITPNSTTRTPASVKKSGPFISDDEEETGDQTADDAEDGDFAPNADESDEDSDEEDSQEGTDDDNVQNAQEDSETSNAPEEDHTEEIKNNPNTGRSLFDRVQPPAGKPQSPNAATGNQTSTSSIDWKAASKSSKEASPFPSIPATQSPYKPATTFTFTPSPASKPQLSAGSSVLFGGSTNGQESKFDGMFGSRSGTPDPETSASKPTAPTSTPATPGDHTWKKGQDIKFNLTDATPEKAANASFGTNSLGFSFGNSTTPAPGFLSAAPHLGRESGLSSGISSRATSPGATDNESVATNDTNDDEGAQTDAQQDLMASNPGEENDELIYAVRTKALLLAKGERAKQLKMAENEWKSIGLGELRLLKNPENGRVRVLLRSTPGANIILNNYLEPDVDYSVREQAETQKSGAVFGAFARDGYIDTIVLKVKDTQTAKVLADLMTKHKHDRN